VPGTYRRIPAVKLQRSDYDQAARYLQGAVKLLQRHDPGQTRILCRTLGDAAQQLASDEFLVDDGDLDERMSGVVAVLRASAGKAPVPDAKTEIMKAVAVLRDRS
jgi:hypothetical protein